VEVASNRPVGKLLYDDHWFHLVPTGQLCCRRRNYFGEEGYLRAVVLQSPPRYWYAISLLERTVSAIDPPERDAAGAAQPQHEENRQEPGNGECRDESSSKQEKRIEGVRVVEKNAEMTEPAPQLEDQGAAQSARVALLRWQDDVVMRQAGTSDPEEWKRISERPERSPSNEQQWWRRRLDCD
jgi:hypothetical protein